jgi:D-lyxose ketol-isomerase
MKRSEIDALIDNEIVFFKSTGFSLPPQAYWSFSDWVKNADKVSELRERGCGWDLTDFGSGDYSKIGLLLYTLSNGIKSNPSSQPYANKYLFIGEGQVTPMHHHWSKMEDIINLSGGVLQIKVFNVGIRDSIDSASPVNILVNNIMVTFLAGSIIELSPGERVLLKQNHYHSFWAKKGFGRVLAEEVSMVNDDANDNCFLPEDKIGRFPMIEENSKPKHLLCNELPGTERFEKLKKKYL